MSSVLNTNKLKALYTALVKSRMLQERLDSATPRHALMARAESAPRVEAVVVGAAFDLKPGDCIVPSQQSRLASFVRGEPLTRILALHNDDSGVSPGPKLQIGIGPGLALGAKVHQQSHIALALAGAELLAESGWEEALTFAGVRKLPIVYVLAHSTAQDLRGAAQHSDVPGITVDGSDVVAVYRVMQESIRRARQGHGPTLVEASLGDVDPLQFMENYLRTRGLWSDAWRQRVVEDFKKELDRAAR